MVKMVKNDMFKLGLFLCDLPKHIKTLRKQCMHFTLPLRNIPILSTKLSICKNHIPYLSIHAFLLDRTEFHTIRQ